MRTSLQAIAAELKRLKASGVKALPVSEASMQRLRKAVQARAGQAQPAPLLSAPARPEKDETSTTYQFKASERVYQAKPVDTGAPPIPEPTTFQVPPGEKSARWNALREIVLNDPVCKAHVRPSKKVVFGVGSVDAKIMFVGEAPGADEEVQGEPFVGPAGQLLTRMIGAMGLKRSDVYIGNIMNWRPEMPVDERGVQYGNRPPTEKEMAYCLPYLKGQIEVVNPDLLVALGSTAAQGLLGFGTFKALGEVRGRWKEFAGKPLMITYHPSYILRNQSNRSKRMIWEDLLQVMERAGLPISEKQRGFFLDRG
ncbi:MAG: uracil-DNA glycosylase [Verrucomicrobia bacterium]|nr:uracil-DNA glycosylase [Verrucomicrobiota bacterium]